MSDDAAGILDTMPEADLRLHSEFRHRSVNRAAEQLLGKNRANLLGKVFWEVNPELAGTPFEGNYRRAMAERATVTLEDFRKLQQRWYGITVTPELEGGIVVHLADLSERDGWRLWCRLS